MRPVSVTCWCRTYTPWRLPPTTDEMRAAIQYAIDPANAEEVRERAERGRHWVMEHFTFDRYRKRVLDITRIAVESRRNARLDLTSVRAARNHETTSRTREVRRRVGDAAHPTRHPQGRRVTAAGCPQVPTVRVAGIDVAALALAQAVDAVLDLVESDQPTLIVTPNVDHLVLLERDEDLAAAYDAASLRFVDGSPVVLLTRLLGTPVPGRVTGVDLTVALLTACEQQGLHVYFLGGAPEILEQAVTRIGANHPDLEITGSASPQIDLETPSESELLTLAECRERSPNLVFVFLGTPKQEKWFLRRRDQLPPAVVLAVGGTVDFLAGATSRAPVWVQRIGCEWLWRLAHEPRRLFQRYVIRDSRFVVIAARAYRDHLRERRARRQRNRP